jgi:membrane protein
MDRLFVRLWRARCDPLHPLYRAAMLWDEADGMRMSAAMSFYGILSLAPLLVLLVALLGWWVDRELLSHGWCRRSARWWASRARP